MRRVIPILLFLGIVLGGNAQEMMKPSVMVVPSDNWCHKMGYMIDINGEKIPDYKKAIVNDPDLINVIAAINNFMARYGFPLENLETVLKNLKTEKAEKVLWRDKEGNAISSSPLDELYKASSADIVLQLTWSLNKVGPKKSINFNLQALDSYTAKQVAGVEGAGAPSMSADVAVLLSESVADKMKNFCGSLDSHFQDILSKGREISVEAYIADGAGIDFETDYDDYELQEVITRMVSKEAVNHSFARAPSTSTMLAYKSVRCPVKDADGILMDAYAFGRKIARALKKDPYSLSVTTKAKGLGKVILIIGGE